jgi:hypothetical protein
MSLPDWFKPSATPSDAAQDMPGEDDAHRIHIAASDPAFPAKREQAVTLICAAIDAIATPMGYTCKGSTWSRSTPQGRTVVNLQRSQYGWYATINLRFILPNGEAASSGVWASGDDVHLGQFYQPDETHGAKPGRIAYLDVSADAAGLDLPITILRTRALPWLDAHHDGDRGITKPL